MPRTGHPWADIMLTRRSCAASFAVRAVRCNR